MCGIAGFTGPTNANLLHQMTDALIHRGPDEAGFYEETNQVSLGHRRLSIIDLKTGSQPIFDSDRSVVVVYNGEIYNFKELREELKSKGYIFRTQTDTEVIVHAYKAYGVESFKKFNGMFAFALWDKTNQTLYLARDRFGIKPLYYTILSESVNTKALLFASEMKVLLKHSSIRNEINPDSIYRYFSYRYIPGQDSIYQNIHKLLPGQYLKFKQGTVKLNSYWDLFSNTMNIAESQSPNVAEEFKDLMCDAVQKCLISDVPVGLFLSGGVDSTSLAAAMHHLGHAPIRTFSIGFGLPNIDELSEAKEVSSYFGTEHMEFILKPKDLEVLPQILRTLDEPNADSIMIPLYWLFKHASESVKVALSGEGGDEIFGGYFYQKKLLKLMNLDAVLPPMVFDVAARVVGHVPIPLLDLFFEYSESMGAAGKNRLVNLLKQHHSSHGAYRTIHQLFTNEDLKGLFRNDFLESLKDFSNTHDPIEADLFRLAENSARPLEDRLILREMRYWLPDYILIRQDKLSMAHSLETRVPYLDHRLLEFLLAMPTVIKRKNMHHKYLLRNTVNSLFPQHGLLNQKKKKAFFLPFSGEFKKPFDGWIRDYLDSDRIKKEGIFNPFFIDSLKNNVHQSPLLVQKQLMALIVWEMWRED